MPDSFDGFCSLWPGADLEGGRMRGMPPPTSRFGNVFDVHNFFIILSFLDSNMSYALSTHKLKMREQNALYLAKHSELGSKN